MKRYLLFIGLHYYPLGGWDDFKDSFDTVEEAKQYFTDLDMGCGAWSQIIDTHT